MAEMNKETEKKINELQMLEQSVQNLLMQKQQFQAQSIEIESAMKELKNTKQAYKIVGNIMVSSPKEELEKDLGQKLEMVQLRINNIEKQENKLKERTKAIQEEVMKELKKE